MFQTAPAPEGLVVPGARGRSAADDAQIAGSAVIRGDARNNRHRIALRAQQLIRLMRDGD